MRRRISLTILGSSFHLCRGPYLKAFTRMTAGSNRNDILIGPGWPTCPEGEWTHSSCDTARWGAVYELRYIHGFAHLFLLFISKTVNKQSEGEKRKPSCLVSCPSVRPARSVHFFNGSGKYKEYIGVHGHGLFAAQEAGQLLPASPQAYRQMWKNLQAKVMLYKVSAVSCRAMEAA